MNQDAIPLRQRSRSRRVIILALVAVFVLILALRSIATVWTDFMWFDSLGLQSVWQTLVFTRVWLVVAATLFGALVIWVNLWLADKLSPRPPYFAGTPDEELIERWQDWVAPRERLVRTVVALGLGVMLGLGAALWWQDFLMFRYGGEFGRPDPIFGHDVGEYVFRFPFYRSLFGWVFQVVVVTVIVVAVAHYLNGGIQVQSDVRRVNPGVKVHLSVLFAVLALLKAVGYYLDTWALLFSQQAMQSNTVTGAFYADVHAKLPALRLLILISIVAAIIMLVNLRFRGWTLPLVALGLWLFTSVVVGGLYPAFVQRFQVEPDQVNKEVEFVEHNISETRYAFGLDKVQVAPFAASPDLDVDDLEANRDTIDNIRLWDPSVLNNTYRELQEIRTFYRIEDVDVDRYTIDGDLTQVMVSARELDESGIPGGGWVNETLVYTHGFGAVLSPANDVTAAGQPEFLVRDIPPLTDAPELEITQPRIYFSDFADSDYLVVNTNEPEVDYPVGDADVAPTNYDGDGGVLLGGMAQRAAWALRFGDVDVLISGQLRSDSRVLLERNVRDRVQQVAPFLYPDADPYLVIHDGRLIWVLDLYTVSDSYPYSTAAITSRLDRTPGLPSGFNYVRNPVKATVDAFSGEMIFYVIDETDPLIQAQRRIFPDVFTDEPVPTELAEHIRYPEDLFRVQSDMYLLYHMTDPSNFFRTVDPWQIASDPSDSERDEFRGTFTDAEGNDVRPMLPYYLQMKLPDEEQLSFILMQPFTPENRPNMVSFMAATSGPEGSGELIDSRLPANSAQQGPGQVGQFINQDTRIAAEFTLLSQGGSDIIQGNMLVVPIEESLLYVQPIYIEADANGASREASGIPEFKRVVMSFNGQIEIGDSLDQTFELIFGAAPGDDGPAPPTDPTTPPTTEEPGDVPEELEVLLAQIDQALADAADALARSDLATYQAKVDETAELTRQALELSGITTDPDAAGTGG